MRILAIIPTAPDLPTLSGLEELGRIGRLDGVTVLPLSGHVTRQDVASALGSRRWDVVIWIGHGREGMLLLSDGDAVRPPWLAQMMRGRVRLALLSVCASGTRPASEAGLVEGFSDTLPAVGVSLAAMMFAVEDRSAMRYDIALLQALAAGARGWQAHQAGLGAIAGSSMVQAPLFFEGVAVADFRTDGQPDQTQRMVYDLVARMGVVETRLTQISDDQREQQEMMREMRTDIKALAPAGRRVEFPREFVMFVSMAALLSTLLLIYVAWRLV